MGVVIVVIVIVVTGGKQSQLLALALGLGWSLTINLVNYENGIVLRCVWVVVLTISDIVPKHLRVIRNYL